METYKCKCGHQASFIAGLSLFENRYEQYHCDKCHRTFITRNGRYIREGTLPEPTIYDTPSGLYNDDDW